MHTYQLFTKQCNMGYRLIALRNIIVAVCSVKDTCIAWKHPSPRRQEAKASPYQRNTDGHYTCNMGCGGKRR